MYKPNFCAECGAQILRDDWHFWTSRRFCDTCARRFRKERFMLPLIIYTGLFATGLVAGRAARPAPPPLAVERGAAPLVTPALTDAPKNRAPVAQALTTREAATAPEVGPINGPEGTPAAQRSAEPNEVVSICGARTQKGTPCQRRVRGTGRCWQHLGMAAIIPEDKRIVSGKEKKD
jgi:hypothetical protein